MSKILDTLNRQQRESVLHNEGPLAIIAGAGSGKTRTITHKIAYLIAEENIKPWQILAVTFTNKAARELKERVSKMVGEGGDKVFVATFHSLCARILREDIDAIGYPKNFNIIDTDDQKQLLRPGYKKLGLSPKGTSFSSVIEFISKQKNFGATPEKLWEEARTDNEKALVGLYEHYLEAQKQSKALDFDDLLMFTNRLFKEVPEVAQKWINRFAYVLVDEFQDTSLVQYEIIRGIAPHNQITVVGDPDQTIYTWRFADPKLILDFKKNFENSHIVLLEENYRSTPQILDAANKLINNNKERFKKNLYTSNNDGDAITYYHGFSEEAEARWVVERIRELRQNKVQLKDVAILYRANYLSQPLEKALMEANFNYVLYGGVRFYQREEIKDAVSFLKVINNSDEVALKRIINVPSRKIGDTAQEKLESMRVENNLTTWELITKHFSSLPLQKAALVELATFVNAINKYRIALKTNPISLVLDKFLKEIKYYDMWSSPEEMARIENLKELVKSIEVWEKANTGKELNDFIDEISLYIDRDENPLSADFVSLMTVHTSKGLEFKNVFVYGFSEGVFPSSRTIGGEDSMDPLERLEALKGLEEERRLAYVAVTRAQERLYLSSSRGFAIDFKTEKRPSRFLSEMGIDPQKYTREFIAPKSFKDNYEEDKNLIEGDHVSHPTFGEGVVVNIQGETASIAFKAPHGVKSLMKNHKSITKVGN